MKLITERTQLENQAKQGNTNFKGHNGPARPY